ncbi:MAG: hypothetical protein HRT61_18755, partial [Ekhidna sp.]|nr:hypothetical protein [Ekhidna sp.]
MKRKLKKILLSLLLLPLFIYTGFIGLQYIKGSKYLPYLERNTVSYPLDSNYSFELMDSDIKTHPLILVGEIHGFHEPIAFDVQFFTYLNSTYDVKDFFVEMDYSQAYFMNKYNKEGDPTLLARILENWVVSQGRNNLDYRNKWVALKDLFQAGQTFRYHGNNNIKDVSLLFDHLAELSDEFQLAYEHELSDSLNLIYAKRFIETINIEDDEEHAFSIKHIVRNIDFFLENKHREEVLTENFLSLHQYHALKQRKVYGFYGLGHTLMAPFEGGYKAMALRLTETDDWFKDKILSINFIFHDSKMVVRSSSLPSILQDEGEYTRLSVSYDNILTSYLHGISDLTRITSPN